MTTTEFTTIEKNGIHRTTMIEYDPSLAKKNVYMQPTEEVCKKNLGTSFKSRIINMEVFACIVKGS